MLHDLGDSFFFGSFFAIPITLGPCSVPLIFGNSHLEFGAAGYLEAHGTQ